MTSETVLRDLAEETMVLNADERAAILDGADALAVLPVLIEIAERATDDTASPTIRDALDRARRILAREIAR